MQGIDVSNASAFLFSCSKRGPGQKKLNGISEPKTSAVLSEYQRSGVPVSSPKSEAWLDTGRALVG
jgi:hypothetical protein